jgi:hypothetical protein
MFRVASGFKTKYHYLTLLVASDFDEWKVVVHGPGICIHGGRQFNEAKAKEHARVCAADYVHKEKQDDLPVLEQVDWQPLTPGEWLNWRPG